MIVPSTGPRGRYPLFRSLVIAMGLCGLLAALNLWAALEVQRQHDLPWQALLAQCRGVAAAQDLGACSAVQPLVVAADQHMAVLLLLQGMSVVLIGVGAALIGRRAHQVLVQRTREAVPLLPPAARERGRDELDQLVEGLAELSAQARGVAAAERWQGRVDAEQTRRSGVALHALHQAVRLLARGEASEVRLRQALQLLEASLGARTVALRLQGGAREALGGGELIATHGEPRALAQLAPLAPAAHDTGARLIAPGPEQPCTSLVVPLVREQVALALLVAEFTADERVDDARVQLAESFARLAALSISSLSRSQEERRVALMEERGAIAAELHDSLAQALAYMKIQVARLGAALERDMPREELRRTIDELRDGLSAAYRQLRELISAFRLRLGPGGLRAALQELVDGFGQRSAPEIEFEDGLGSCRLEPNEELHVLQLVREAVANAVRHAQAGLVQVAARYQPAQHLLTVTIEDDGQGLAGPAGEAGGAGHYGLSIMRERAHSLRGEFRIEPREGGGTRVLLSFAPQRFPPGPSDAADAHGAAP